MFLSNLMVLDPPFFYYFIKGKYAKNIKIVIKKNNENKTTNPILCYKKYFEHYY